MGKEKQGVGEEELHTEGLVIVFRLTGDCREWRVVVRGESKERDKSTEELLYT